MFAGIAVVIGCLCRGRFNNLFILIAGERDRSPSQVLAACFAAEAAGGSQLQQHTERLPWQSCCQMQLPVVQATFSHLQQLLLSQLLVSLAGLP